MFEPLSRVNPGVEHGDIHADPIVLSVDMRHGKIRYAHSENPGGDKFVSNLSPCSSYH